MIVSRNVVFSEEMEEKSVVREANSNREEIDEIPLEAFSDSEGSSEERETEEEEEGRLLLICWSNLQLDGGNVESHSRDSLPATPIYLPFPFFVILAVPIVLVLQLFLKLLWFLKETGRSAPSCFNKEYTGFESTHCASFCTLCGD